ncbi:MAG: ABC transporter ATP-binding protein [Kiritimatiellae bacterium]|nr:ABC transporter ATP-binding protein [Kiritimatiellia bacterium]MDW8459038.1 ABC transporter ATP-binding protein [Verrucomicrobiota bacterium]
MNRAIPQIPVLEMRGVWKTYATPAGPRHALHEVNLTIEQGSFVMVTGPSGSGKSTLLHLAGLLDTPTQGVVWFAGRRVSDLPERDLCQMRKARIGMVFQRFCLLTRRTALENVRFRFRYLEVPPSRATRLAEEALARVGLADRASQPVRLMSGGEMQRIAIARAVAQPPDLLIADEPTGNLDRESAERVMDVFRELHASGITILLATHNESLLRHATRRLICRDGRIENSP